VTVQLENALNDLRNELLGVIYLGQGCAFNVLIEGVHILRGAKTVLFGNEVKLLENVAAFVNGAIHQFNKA